MTERVDGRELSQLGRTVAAMVSATTAVLRSGLRGIAAMQKLEPGHASSERLTEDAAAEEGKGDVAGQNDVLDAKGAQRGGEVVLDSRCCFLGQPPLRCGGYGWVEGRSQSQVDAEADPALVARQQLDDVHLRAAPSSLHDPIDADRDDANHEVDDHRLRDDRLEIRCVENVAEVEHVSDLGFSSGTIQGGVLVRGRHAVATAAREAICVELSR